MNSDALHYTLRETMPNDTQDRSARSKTVEEQLLARRAYDEEIRTERHQEQQFLSWDAPSRPYKKRDREFYTTIGVIVFLVSLILFFAGQFLFIAVVVSLAFVAYVINTVPPETVRNSITSFGIHNGETLYYWEELGRFWFSKQYGQNLLHIETARAFPGVLVLLIQDLLEDDLKKVLLKYTVFEKPKDTQLDKWAKWLTEKFPLDST